MTRQRPKQMGPVREGILLKSVTLECPAHQCCKYGNVTLSATRGIRTKVPWKNLIYSHCNDKMQAILFIEGYILSVIPRS